MGQASLLVDVGRKIHGAAEHDLLNAVWNQHCAGGDAHEGIAHGRKGLVERGEYRKNQTFFVNYTCSHALLTFRYAVTFKVADENLRLVAHGCSGETVKLTPESHSHSVMHVPIRSLHSSILYNRSHS